MCVPVWACVCVIDGCVEAPFVLFVDVLSGLWVVVLLGCMCWFGCSCLGCLVLVVWGCGSWLCVCCVCLCCCFLFCVGLGVCCLMCVLARHLLVFVCRSCFASGVLGCCVFLLVFICLCLGVCMYGWLCVGGGGWLVLVLCVCVVCAVCVGVV